MIFFQIFKNPLVSFGIIFERVSSFSGTEAIEYFDSETNSQSSDRLAKIFFEIEILSFLSPFSKGLRCAAFT